MVVLILVLPLPAKLTVLIDTGAVCRVIANLDPSLLLSIFSVFFPDLLYFFCRHKRKLKAIVAGSTGEQCLGFSSCMTSTEGGRRGG